MSASDAVILLLADGLVAVGRVLRGVRHPSGAEVRAQAVGEADRLAEAEEAEEVWAPHDPYLNCCPAHDPVDFDDGPDELWRPAPVCGEYVTSSNRCLLNPGHFGDHDDDPPTRACQVRSAAVSPPAADNTTTADHLEAAFNYHKGAVGYAAMRAGGVEWFCEGCNWSGPTKQAHARHRFQVLADMKNATTRVQEQLGGTA